jgi:hypothetical protein
MANRYFYRCYYCKVTHASKQGFKPVNGHLACRTCQDKIQETIQVKSVTPLSSFLIHKVRQYEKYVQQCELTQYSVLTFEQWLNQ